MHHSYGKVCLPLAESTPHHVKTWVFQSVGAKDSNCDPIKKNLEGSLCLLSDHPSCHLHYIVSQNLQNLRAKLITSDSAIGLKVKDYFDCALVIYCVSSVEVSVKY